METRNHHIQANGLNHVVDDFGDIDAPPALLLHGFPDSRLVWQQLTPLLVEGGFRVIAPDLRGFGDTDMASSKKDYEINVGAIPDMLALISEMKIAPVHIVGHDFGAPVAWGLASQNPTLTRSLTALSVGRARAFLQAGSEQKIRSWYILMHQVPWLCESLYQAVNWAVLRHNWSGLGDIDKTIALLARPGRLKAALDWYRSNLSVARMLNPPPFGAYGEEVVKVPTLGIWSDSDPYLTEAQMTLSKQYVEAPWRFERLANTGHWLQCDAPEELTALLLRHWLAVDSKN